MDLQAVKALNKDLTAFTGDIFKYLGYQGQRSYGQHDGQPVGSSPQDLGHFIAQSTWDYTEVMRRIAARAVSVLDPVAWPIDDHPFVRYGHSTAVGLKNSNHLQRGDLSSRDGRGEGAE